MVAALGLGVANPAPARADNRGCRVVDVTLHAQTPIYRSWPAEDPQGHFLETLGITQLTGTYGLDRPRHPRLQQRVALAVWPPRETCSPVWAHRHGMVFPEVVFQDANVAASATTRSFCSAEDLSNCRPMLRTGPSREWDVRDLREPTWCTRLWLWPKSEQYDPCGLMGAQGLLSVGNIGRQ